MEKRKMRFNAIDLIFVIAVLAIVAAFVIRQVSTSGSFVEMSKEGDIPVMFEIEVKVSGIQEESKNYIELGDIVGDMTGKKYAQIKKLNILPAEGYYVTESGEIKRLSIPGKIDAYITLECMGKIRDNTMFMSNGTFINVSDQLGLYLQKIDIYGYITSINYEEVTDEAYQTFVTDVEEKAKAVFKPFTADENAKDDESKEAQPEDKIQA